MKILYINASDVRGGAALVAQSLYQAFQKEGFESYMVVKRKVSADVHVQELENKLNRWEVVWRGLAESKNFKSINFISTLCNWLAQPGKNLRRVLGIEEFDFPASRKIDITKFDLVHCHVLHGGYFDLRLLQEWSHNRPVAITLHDAWLLAGHCAHSFACEKWLTGCGACPDISIPVAIEHDNSTFNWKRKKKIFEKSHLYVAAPSEWLLNKAKRSILNTGTKEFRHIPHGVDISLFQPADRSHCRSNLGLPDDAFIFLFAANGIRKNRWKDFATLVAAVRKLAGEVTNRKVLFVALGQEGKREDFGSAQIHFVSYIADRKTVADYYSAANVYVHAARAETFPNAIMEALASGIPVVASAVGGIPEQVTGLAEVGFRELNSGSIEHSNGVLVPPENVDALVQALHWLLERPLIVDRLGRQARIHAVQHFDLNTQLAAYKSWYLDIQKDFQALVS